jgi:hypothetical protein
MAMEPISADCGGGWVDPEPLYVYICPLTGRLIEAHDLLEARMFCKEEHPCYNECYNRIVVYDKEKLPCPDCMPFWGC